MTSEPRIFIAAIINENQEIKLSLLQSHHLINVLRLKDGDFIETAGQNSKVFRSQIKISGKEVTALAKEEISQAVSPLKLTLLIAACKGEKNDFIIEKGTELGVSKFIFFQSEHSVGKLSENHLERFSRKAEAAASQSRRNNLPKIEIFKNLVSAELEFSGNIKILFSLSKNSRSLKPEQLPTDQILLAVGPEGDFSPLEYDYFREQGFIEASLGSNILRSETAAIAAIASVIALKSAATPFA